MLNEILKDDNTEMGGVDHYGETLKDFLISIDRTDLLNKVQETKVEINELLKDCGIEPIA